MPISETQRDLFSLNHTTEYCLCHCVSVDLAMGKGIAVAFRDRFGRIEHLRALNPKVGDACSLENGDVRIYYLITKLKYFHKPTYESLETALVAMRDDMLARGYPRVGMPKIGCGLDRLAWTEVKLIIERVFGQSGIDVAVCIQ